jgi:hypothetical protein
MQWRLGRLQINNQKRPRAKNAARATTKNGEISLLSVHKSSPVYKYKS